MKNNTICFLFLLFFFSSCSKKIIVDSNNYAWKSFGKTSEQSVDLSKYKSPNLRDDRQDPEKLVILCASGGGSRAASFTIGTLLELEKIILDSKDNQPIDTLDNRRNVLSEIDFFTTTSGGGWGSATYIAFKYQNNKYGIDSLNNYPTYNSFESHLANWADRRYVRYQFKYFLGGLFSKSFHHTSSGVMMDRLNTGYLGRSYRVKLERQKWELYNTTPFDSRKVKSIKLQDVFVLKDSPSSPKLPMLIPNTTNLINYQLVPFTPDRLHYSGLRQYTYTTISGPTLEPEVPHGILEMDALLDIPLAAGIKASSSVPGFIGSSIFASRKRGIEYNLRLEDGGITDNFGLHTAKAILSQEKDIKEKENRIVIVIDASSQGIRSAKKKRPVNSRFFSVSRVFTAAPDAQYPITRERIEALENEYNCTVIYLGTEVLLDPALGKGGRISSTLEYSKKNSEKDFYDSYNIARKDINYFNTLEMSKRALLYEYIRSNVRTWFTARNTPNKGRYVPTNIDKWEGTGTILFLAGRGVVQLKRDEILNKLNTITEGKSIAK